MEMMMMGSFDINEYIKANRKHAVRGGLKYFELTPRIECVDGFSVSAQADYAKYCTPRDNIGPYTTVELGYPSTDDPLIDEYFDGGVYPQVPVDVVNQLIDSHGGVDG